MKKVISVLLVAVMAICLCSCGTTYQEAISRDGTDDFANGYFTQVTEWSDAISHYKIVYANDTKVKYFVVYGSNESAITPLYNADGTLQIYEEGEK